MKLLSFSSGTPAILIAGAFLSFANQVCAESEPPSTSSLALGVVAFHDRKPYRGMRAKSHLLPFVLYENRWVSVAGPTVDFKLASTGGLSFRMRAQYAGDGYEQEDSSELTGMAERKAGVWVGPALRWRSEWANFSAEMLLDATDRSDGRKLRIGAEKTMHVGPFSLTPRMSLTRFDRRFVDYYFGVRADEATQARPAHAGQAGHLTEAALRVGYATAPRDRVFLDVGVQRHSGSIGASPIVGSRTNGGIRLAYLKML